MYNNFQNTKHDVTKSPEKHYSLLPKPTQYTSITVKEVILPHKERFVLVES